MKKGLLIHSCWAAAVILAFGIGSRRASIVSSSDTAAIAGASTAAAAKETITGAGPFSGGKGERVESRIVSALESLFSAIQPTGGDLTSLIQQALRDGNPITRRLAFARLLESLTPENAASVREQLVALGAEPDQWRDFHYTWGALDGKAALASAKSSPEADLAITVTGWAAANPAEALAMLDNLPPELADKRHELAASVVSGLTHKNPAMAAEYVIRLGAEGNPKAGSLIETAANATLRQLGPEAAARWAESLSDGPLKGNAMAKVAESYARSDPEGAARWTERYADKEFASRTIAQVGERWAKSNPTAAAGWLENLPASAGQKQGLSGVFGDWEDSDPAAAGDYLMSMPKSPQRDAAISGFASGYAWQDPHTALAWAQDISDPVIRESSLTRVGEAYYRKDPDGAIAWMNQSGLPEEARQRIMTLERRR